MSRAAGLCGRCGGPRRGRGARPSDPIADCGHCSTPVCKKHARWDPAGDRYVCTKCARDNDIPTIRVR